MTTLDHLRKLLSQPCPRDYYENCWYCTQPTDSHAPDCEWEAAKAYVEEEDKAILEMKRMPSAISDL